MADRRGLAAHGPAGIARSPVCPRPEGAAGQARWENAAPRISRACASRVRLPAAAGSHSPTPSRCKSVALQRACTAGRPLREGWQDARQAMTGAPKALPSGAGRWQTGSMPQDPPLATADGDRQGARRPTPLRRRHGSMWNRHAGCQPAAWRPDDPAPRTSRPQVI